MRVRPIILILTLVAMAAISDEVRAQSLFSGGGSLGGTNTGGQQTVTQVAQGQSTSGINTGQTLGTTNLNAADGSLSATVGQGGFVGGQNNGAFVGNRFAGQSASQSNQAQFGNLQSNNRTQNRNNQQRTDRKSVRPQYRISFTAPVIPRSDLQSRLTFGEIQIPSEMLNVDGVIVKVEEQGLVTLSGVVATERDSKLLESYVRMEPGVRKVNNALAVSDGILSNQ